MPSANESPSMQEKDGANSQLLSLFSPPSSSSSKSEQSKTTEQPPQKDDIKTGEGTKSPLEDLDDSVPPPPQETSSENNVSPSFLRAVPPPSSEEGSIKTTPRTTTSSSLTGLFAPPLDPLSSPSVTNPTDNSSHTRLNDQEAATTTMPMPSSLAGLFAPPLPNIDEDKLISAQDSKLPTLRTKTGRVEDNDGERTALLSKKTSDNNNGYDYYIGFEEEVLVPIHESPTMATQMYSSLKKNQLTNKPKQKHRLEYLKNVFQNQILQPTTLAGSFMFLLYHIVFCLANGSAILRPHSQQPMLGIMAKISTVGIIFAAPFYIYRFHRDVPALYPSVDLFVAPFLAQAAALIDESLTQEYSGNGYPDQVFFATFAVLTGIGMLLAGTFLVAAATFKLANLGTYLPYSVLCGFFSAVGVLLWSLAFNVDTSGQTWQTVFFSGDSDLIWNACLHHLPSLIIGILMNILGPKNPFFVILLVLATLICFYLVLWISGTTLGEAQQAQWFWSPEELIYENPNTTDDGSWYLPPTPFASVTCLFSKYTNWTAVYKGLGNMVAMAFLYLLRSSIHASALKKNIGNLVRRVPIVEHEEEEEPATTTEKGGGAYGMASNIFGSVRQSVQIVNMSFAEDVKIPSIRPRLFSEDQDVAMPSAVQKKNNVKSSQKTNVEYTEIRAKASKKTLEEIFKEYGYALFVVAVCGGFGNCPTVATSNTMFAIGAEGPAPQYGSVLLLIVFYFTNFELVQYIPKAAFSSLLVLGAVDTLVVWFLGAFRKTQDIAEWLVVPIIVGFSLFVGFLNAVFLGIGISMFVFVASFFRIGVVKFNATGLEIHSRIERSMTQSVWLDSNGDMIQVLVVQNYLFFGNASSILNYIATMFEEVDGAQSERLDFSIPPIPKVLVLDLSLITGMDTSTVDIFAEIQQLCKHNECKLYLSGLSPRMRKGLSLGGVKPEAGARSQRTLRFFPDMDSALGKAEDWLLNSEMIGGGEPQRPSPGANGFQYALMQIDELHGKEFAHGLVGLQSHVVALELDPGQFLFQGDVGVVQEGQRGLFFIESGLLKIERDSSQSLTMSRTRSSHSLAANSILTLKHQHARMGSIARKAALAKSSQHGGGPQTLRLARIGPGWVCGTLENALGFRSAGVTIAVTHCRLHHLPFQKLEELEQEEPVLMLRLYKMLSHLIAQKEEITIEHLSSLHSIMSSPAHSKPMSRAAIKTFSGA